MTSDQVPIGLGMLALIFVLIYGIVITILEHFKYRKVCKALEEYLKHNKKGSLR